MVKLESALFKKLYSSLKESLLAVITSKMESLAQQLREDLKVVVFDTSSTITV